MDHSFSSDKPLNAYSDCSIYVNRADREDVTGVLERSGASRTSDGLLRYGEILAYVAHNDYEGSLRGDAPAFLDWPTVLECEALSGAAPPSIVSAVASMLEVFSHAGWRAEAACDFEDEIHQLLKDRGRP
ncbi:hypothetical protein ACWEFL_17005 [Streptomyces sp. NPDC004838]